MLNIDTFRNYKNNIVQKQINQNNYKINPFRFKNTNLKPLAQDTVSFTGVLEFQTAINNADVCRDLNENAKDAQEYLLCAFEKHFEPLVYHKDTRETGIIDALEGRIKSPESIQEKIADKIEKALKSNSLKEDIFSPTNANQIKEKLRDIVGVRLVMRKASDRHIDEVVEQLCNTILGEELVIDEIENHVSANPNIKPYFSKAHLEKLQNAANEIRAKNGLQPIGITPGKSTSGYMALHLDVNLKNIGKYDKNRNYHGELQILGADVAMLKDIEDLCYKLKQGKKIKTGHPAYMTFEKYFADAYQDNEKYPNVIKDFERYTKKAFEMQRDRQASDDISDDITNWAYKYPTIKECGLEGKIPPILDFNILARAKRDCDDLLKIATRTQDILDGKTP